MSNLSKKNNTEMLTEMKYESLTPENKKEVDSFVERMDLMNYDMRTNYAGNALQSVKDYSEKYLQKVKNTGIHGKEALDEVSGDIKSLLIQVEKTTQKKFFILELISKITTNAKKKYENMRYQLETVSQVVKGIEKRLIASSDDAQISVIDAEEFGKSGINVVKALDLYIIAGGQIIKRSEKELSVLKELAAKSQNFQDIKKVDEFERSLNQFRVIVSDIKASKAVTIIQIKQALVLREEAAMQHFNIRRMLTQLIPIILGQCAAAVQQKRIDIRQNEQELIKNTVENLLRQNVDNMSETTKKIAEQANKPLIDANVIVEVFDKLQNLNEEVKKIIEKSKEEREKSEAIIEERINKFMKKVTKEKIKDDYSNLHLSTNNEEII